jgi:hypothetical protein
MTFRPLILRLSLIMKIDVGSFLLLAESLFYLSAAALKIASIASNFKATAKPIAVSLQLNSQKNPECYENL